MKKGSSKLFYFFVMVFFICSPHTSGAKSLYAIGNINASPTPILSYDMQGDSLTYQATNLIPRLAGGAVGITIDTDSSTLFVTYEGSKTIQLVNAENMSALGTTDAPGASNLAGIVVDQGKRKVYTVDRSTNRLYSYSWNKWTYTLTLDPDSPISLAGVVGAFGIAIDETDAKLYIADYNGNAVRAFDTNTWQQVDFFTVSHRPIGIAVDVVNKFVYTGSGWASNTLLCQFDVINRAERSINLSPAGVMGIAVDQTDGNVYFTTGYSGDNLRVYNSNLASLWSSGYIGNGTGLCIPGKNDIAYNPLNGAIQVKSGTTAAPGEAITYHISFSNPTDQTVTGVLVSNPIPTGTSFKDADGNYSFVSGSVVWDFGDIPSGALRSANLTLEVTGNPGDKIFNLTTLSSGSYQPTTREFITEIINSSVVVIPLTEGELRELRPPVVFGYFGKLYAIRDTFDPNEDTYFISHGWNTEDSTNTPQWQIDMAAAISAVHKGANVFLWNWQEEAKTDYGINDPAQWIGAPKNKVEISGINLARAMEKAIKDGLSANGITNYNNDIHLIGHSLGTGVVTYAAININMKYNETISKNIKHIVYLDSPWYFSKPGGNFLEDNQDNIFFENYWSQVGRIVDFDIEWSWTPIKTDFLGYSVADLNAKFLNLKVANPDILQYDTQFWYLGGLGDVLDSVGFTIESAKEFFAGIGEAHSLSHKWYLSSITNFDTPSILEDTSTPDEPTPYGFYWSYGDGLYNNDYPQLTHDIWSPKWKLRPGLWDIAKGGIIETWNFVAPKVVYAAGVAADLSVEAYEEIKDFAEETKSTIVILSVNAFNTAEDIKDYVTDKATHAAWVVVEDVVLPNAIKLLRLTLNSEAVTSTNVLIPTSANAFRYSFEFPLVDPGTVLEVFINGVPVSTILADSFVGKGQQNSEWIPVGTLAGQNVDLSFRLSNADDNLEGVVNLDDIIFARITPAVDSDNDGIEDGLDVCRNIPNADQADTDGDGVGDACDNCIDDINPDQVDSDNNGLGDVCSFVLGDLDGDGDIDRNDVNTISAYRNQPASVYPECDIDGDGTITILDMRTLMGMCSLPRCAVQ